MFKKKRFSIKPISYQKDWNLKHLTDKGKLLVMEDKSSHPM
jgi:hypothetical protein